MNRIVAIGEIMLRLSAAAGLRFPQVMPGSLAAHFGGAEASVAALVAHLGGRSAYVTALPNNPLGKACVANLTGVGVDMRHSLLIEGGRMGLYFVEHGASHRPGQVIYDRDDSAFAVTPPTAYDWEGILADAGWCVISGITPAISRNALGVAQEAITRARRSGVAIACDLNYRSKLWRWDTSQSPQQLAVATMPAIVGQVDLLVTGRADATMLLGVPAGLSDESVLRELARRYPQLRQIVLTRRSAWSANHQRVGASLLEVDRQQIVHAPRQSGAEGHYDIPDVVDRIGSGDALLGALLYALQTPELAEAQTAISFATAAAVLAHSISGDISFITRNEIEALAAGTQGGRLDR